MRRHKPFKHSHEGTQICAKPFSFFFLFFLTPLESLFHCNSKYTTRTQQTIIPHRNSYPGNREHAVTWLLANTGARERLSMIANIRERTRDTKRNK